MKVFLGLLVLDVRIFWMKRRLRRAQRALESASRRRLWRLLRMNRVIEGL